MRRSDIFNSERGKKLNLLRKKSLKIFCQIFNKDLNTENKLFISFLPSLARQDTEKKVQMSSGCVQDCQQAINSQMAIANLENLRMAVMIAILPFYLFICGKQARTSTR